MREEGLRGSDEGGRTTREEGLRGWRGSIIQDV